MKKKLFLSGTLLSLLFTLYTASAQKVGEKAPDFSYTNLKGDTVKLSHFKGKTVFLFIFGNACPLCLDIGNATETQVNQVYSAKGKFQALGLDTWSNSTTATVGQFKATTKITYPMLLNAGSFEDLYKTSYDRVMVIDSEGILRHKNNSNNTKGDLNNAIAVLEALYLAMDVEDVDGGPKLGLAPVFPNPSDDELTVSFTMANNERVSIRVYNTLGQEVKRILDHVFPSGEHKRAVSVGDLSSGIYIMQMESAGMYWSQKFQVSH